MPSVPKSMKILSINRQQRLDAQNRPFVVYVIAFRIDDAVTDMVEVPEGDYTAAHVRSLIDEKAKIHRELLS